MVLSRKSKYGLEIEMLVLDSEGKLVNGAPKITEAIKGTIVEKVFREEISESVIELAAKEKRTVRECAKQFVKQIDRTIEIAEKEGYHLLPSGTHPATYNVKDKKSTWYDAQKKVLGADIFRQIITCGFHFHYTLPEGILERKTKNIKTVKKSRAKDIFLQQYNFLVACDPAILTFCQSTPFYMGKHWAKDCRALKYRDLKATKDGETVHGMYYYHPLFGSLPGYEFTLEDIRVMADKRKAEFLRLVEQEKYPTNEIACYPSLKFVWGPLRVNKIGTFEYRGPDMNHPSIVFSVSELLVYLLKMIEEREINVEPSDLGIREPFRFEDNTIYVPSYATLKNLERQSIFNGFESSAVHSYCSKLLDLADEFPKTPRNINTIREMVKKKKTTSDEMLEMVKKNGYSYDDVPEDMLNHLALYHSSKLTSDLALLKRQFRI